MHYKTLIRASRTYEAREMREIFYDISTSGLRKSKSNKEKAVAISILLYSWNSMWYFRQYKEQRRKVFNNIDHRREIAKLIKKHSKALKQLKKERLDNIDLEEHGNLIMEMYQDFKQILGPTGTSKTLHLLIPDLFVMWDSKIKRGKREGKNYKKFMFDMQKQAIEAIKSYKKKHKVSFNIARKKLSEKKPIPKLIDEYNYSKMKKWI